MTTTLTRPADIVLTDIVADLDRQFPDRLSAASLWRCAVECLAALDARGLASQANVERLAIEAISLRTSP
jgi:hypothetical protein